jgi:hypothetical protein
MLFFASADEQRSKQTAFFREEISLSVALIRCSLVTLGFSAAAAQGGNHLDRGKPAQ